MSQQNGGRNGTQRFRVEVRLRPEHSDVAGAGALALLQELGLPGVRGVRAYSIYEIEGPLTGNQIQTAARELLCDSVTHEFRIGSPPPAANGMSHWRVEVWLKPSVTDVVGASVREALVELGLPQPKSVRCATAYQISGRIIRAQLEKAIVRSLANPVVHTLSISEAMN
jgi:phosphoribosylformylglycinamidine (FGAM) synthase PurS component